MPANLETKPYETNYDNGQLKLKGHFIYLADSNPVYVRICEQDCQCHDSPLKISDTSLPYGKWRVISKRELSGHPDQKWVKHGDFLLYYETGELKGKGSYHHGWDCGDHIFYDKDGVVTATHNYGLKSEKSDLHPSDYEIKKHSTKGSAEWYEMKGEK